MSDEIGLTQKNDIDFSVKTKLIVVSCLLLGVVGQCLCKRHANYRNE